MKEFNYNKYLDYKWNNNILNLISTLHEYKEKQIILLKQKPATLERLETFAKIQSTEASNAIEGIRTTSSRFKKLYNEKIRPHNRAEEEIMGYKEVLDIINENYNYIPINKNIILQFHRDLFKYSSKGIGGNFKINQNYISAADENNNLFTIFEPLTPFGTPGAVEAICNNYNSQINTNEVDPLILIPVFIHDFLCIHPFNDGNGRMSRLLTNLLLLKNDYIVGKYISLEELIAKNKNQYYDILQECQTGWYEGAENIEPFIEYLLSILLAAYREMENKVNINNENSDSLGIVKNALNQIYGKITKTDLANLCPTISIKTVEAAIKKLVDDKILIKQGRGKGTYYIKNNE